MSESTKNALYMPQLDGLRAFAVVAVLFSHYWAANWGILVSWGFQGVRLFFVLSGFLITGILIRSRDAVDLRGRSSLGELGRFYARRFLRIFPLYYLVIALALLLGVRGIREDLGWLLSYTMNLHLVWDGWFHAGDTVWFHNDFFHLWSLSVEEQFYLAWPWIVLLAPRKWITRIIGAAVVAGVAYRAWAMLIQGGVKVDTLFMFPVTALDTLGIGALLALAVHSAPADKVKRAMNWVVLPVGCVGVVLAHVAALYKPTWALFHVFIDTTLALVCCWLVYQTSLGVRGWVGRTLASGPLRYIGKVSYGIYVYHLFVPALLTPLWVRVLGQEFPKMGPAHFFICSAVTVAIAALSWSLFESPINNLKRHFEAPKAPRLPKPASAMAQRRPSLIEGSLALVQGPISREARTP